MINRKATQIGIDGEMIALGRVKSDPTHLDEFTERKGVCGGLLIYPNLRERSNRASLLHKGTVGIAMANEASVLRGNVHEQIMIGSATA